uniref:Ubiquitin-like protease family profile domain-containing protein n=1 Tax=Setaria digitata TaxID=48799 RepID=A0A915PS20_9BILA
MTVEDGISEDEESVQMSSLVSGAHTCRSLPSPITTCSSAIKNESLITSRPVPPYREEYEEKKDEVRITGGTETNWASRLKRRVHNEELDPQNLDRLISGNKPVLQILLDQKREHYVLVERTLFDDTIIVFDSLATSRKKARDALNRGLAEQIFNMFKHLSSADIVKVRYEIAIEKQDDMWSCGLRTVAYITCRAFDRDPQCYVFKMEKVFKYFCNLLNERNPNAEEFRHAFHRFGKWKHHHLKAEEAIFKITKQVDHQLHIENSEVHEMNMLSDSSTTSSECQEDLKESDKKRNWRRI